MSRPASLLALVAVLFVAKTAEAEFPWFGRAKAPEAKIDWVGDPADALATAAESGRPILAYVTSSNCGYCRKMEKETWSQPAIGRLVGQNFVPLKLHADDHPEAVAGLGVKAFPTTVLITPEGKAFAGKPGFLEPLELTQLLRPAIAKREVAARTAAIN